MNLRTNSFVLANIHLAKQKMFSRCPKIAKSVAKHWCRETQTGYSRADYRSFALLPLLPDCGRPALLELNAEFLQLLSALSAYLSASKLSVLINVVPEELWAILDEFQRPKSNTSEIIDAIKIQYGNTQSQQNPGKHENSPNPVVANKQRATTSKTVSTRPSKPPYCPRKDVRSDQSTLSDDDNGKEFDNESLTTLTEAPLRQTTTTTKTARKRVNSSGKRAMPANEKDEILSDATYDPSAPKNSVQIGSSSLTGTGRQKQPESHVTSNTKNPAESSEPIEKSY